MYDYRKMSPEQRRETVNYRRLNEHPLHSPPHWNFIGNRQFIISAACYEHAHNIGVSHQRMTDFEHDLLEACEKFAGNIYAWCVCPNHYHVLLRTDNIEGVRSELGLLHGRSSYKWNGEDNKRGRKVWFNCFDRTIKSHRHFWATMNYVHNNPVHHGYVDQWQDWLWSSAASFLEKVGRERAQQIWKEFPVLDYGKKWDEG
ncbi:MAG TPA: transposase [Pyrinomonadaceae bacterium]|nr:transposase [Pyrinomonadaceae bacterium]